MAFDSFRQFMVQLDQAGGLKRITRPVTTELEITELADREMKSFAMSLLVRPCNDALAWTKFCTKSKPGRSGAAAAKALAVNTRAEKGQQAGQPEARKTVRVTERSVNEEGIIHSGVRLRDSVF